MTLSRWALHKWFEAGWWVEDFLDLTYHPVCASRDLVERAQLASLKSDYHDDQYGKKTKDYSHDEQVASDKKPDVSCDLNDVGTILRAPQTKLRRKPDHRDNHQSGKRENPVNQRVSVVDARLFSAGLSLPRRSRLNLNLRQEGPAMRAVPHRSIHQAPATRARREFRLLYDRDIIHR